MRYTDQQQREWKKFKEEIWTASFEAEIGSQEMLEANAMWNLSMEMSLHLFMTTKDIPSSAAAKLIAWRVTHTLTA